MPQLITEAGTLTPSGTGRLKITLITPGWGSSGYYSPELLEQAAKDRVFPKGTQQHIDHMSPSDQMEQPAGSLQTLAAVLTEDAQWEPDHVNEDGTKGRLAADSMIGSTYRQTITEFAEYIGTSISANAEITKGEAEGRTGLIVEKLLPDPLNRVDFVTVAGRGGRISEVVEAAKAKDRAIAHGVDEATVNNTRTWLADALRDANPGRWAYPRDFDESYVYFERDDESPDGALIERLYQQGYTLDGNTATLTGEPVEVKAEVVYTPVTNQTAEESAHKDSASSPAAVTENQEEATMATIDDKELADLRESASRASTAEADLKKAQEELATAREAELRATVTGIVNEAFDGVDAPKGKARLIEALVTAEEFDADKAKAAAVEEAAEYRAANGEGDVRGLGATGAATESKTYSSDDIVAALDGGK